MCNNVVALGNSTKDGVVIFGKNSDRAPNEAHALEQVPAADHPDGSVVRCTYVSIPQVPHTYSVVLARPCWLWGAEMGTNEHGLTIGNTAVFTKVPYETGPGLTGMDFLRLALERAENSIQAVEVITNLLETFGQGGNCGFRTQFYYHNSFLIADHHEVWILETAGKHWVAEKVRDVRATSNTLTITTTYDMISKDTISFAESQGWHKPGKPFNFKKSYGGKGLYPSYLYTFFGRGDGRQNRLTQLLSEQKGRITVASVMAMLRDHGPGAGAGYSPARGLFGNSVCMHTGFGPIRTDQTTGSMVSHLTSTNPTHWLSGTSAPCTSVFKPLWFDTGIPSIGEFPTGQFNQSTLWWQHERLHREVLKDYTHRLPVFKDARDALETRFQEKAASVREKSVDERRAFSQACFDEADCLTEAWTQQVKKEPIKDENPWLYRKKWEELAKDASFYYGSEHGRINLP